ncbi:CpsD/CapB family tyrosine-protein kinase [Aliivibrio wodanis]|uniref:CpsD/CapB family tyrosine-protein kinase n=1 Tax=Aliivibrio wodanis TaxID=80852 RepID=UPI00406C4B86
MRIPSCHMEIEQVFLQLEKHECHSLCITSTNPGEGVSSLAQALTERYLLAGYRTLLVDLNLQNPSLTALSLDLDNNDKEDTHYLNYIEHNSQVVPGIPVPDNKAKIVELRQPKNLNTQIKKWLEKFDKIIIDSSALSQLNANNIPAQSIAGCCDGTIMVVLSGQTLQTELKEALNTLENHHANLIGHVFNDKYQPRLKNEICREIERLHFLPKIITNKLISFVQHNRFLSTVV